MHSVPEDILALSFLAGLPEDLRAQVLAGSHVIQIPPGTVSPSPEAPTAALVLDGVVRMFLSAPSTGRQVTVRYARPGEALGLVHLFGAVTGTQAQSVTQVRLCILQADSLCELAARHAALALAIARECATRASDAMDELSLASFGTVRQRLARHLLDLAATRDEVGHELIAVATQQELANACGSVREVVARVLKELHAEKITLQAPSGVVILNVAALDEATRVT